MSYVKSYRFKKIPPNFKSDLEESKDKWKEFIKYMNNLKKVSNHPSKNHECVIDSYNEEFIHINEYDMNENIDDIIKLKRWNDMKIDNHSIHKESSSDAYSTSNSSVSIFNFNKYNIIQNNIYSNNANLKRQKIKNNYNDEYKVYKNYEIEENQECKKNNSVNSYRKREKKKFYNNLHYKREYKNRISNFVDKCENKSNELILNKTLMKKNQKDILKKKKDKISINNEMENDYEHNCKENYDFLYLKNKNLLEFSDNEGNNENHKNDKLQKNMNSINNIRNNSKKFLKNIDCRKKLNNHELNSINIYNKFTGDSNGSISNNEQNYMNQNIIKKTNKYIPKHSSRLNENKENKLKKYKSIKKKKKKKQEKNEEKIHNLEIDGSYAYNYAYLNKSNESSMPSSIEAVNNTIMNLEEEINNYEFNNFI